MALTNCYTKSVSIHAPGRGATLYSFASSSAARCFNSRTREGCDGIASIRMIGKRSFNSRTREGCDEEDEEEA